MSKYQRIVFFCLSLSRLSIGEKLDLEFRGRMEFFVLENGELDFQHEDLFLNGVKVDSSELPSLIRPRPIVTTSTTRKPATTTPHLDPDPDPDPETVVPPVPTTGQTDWPSEITNPSATTTVEPPDPSNTQTTEPVATTTTISSTTSSVQLPEIRETSDSESTVVFVIIGSIVASIAVSGAIVGLLAHFKATPILAVAIAAE